MPRRTKSRNIRDNTIISIEIDREMYFRCGNAAAATARSFEEFHEQALLNELKRAGVQAADLEYERACRQAYDRREPSPVRHTFRQPTF